MYDTLYIVNSTDTVQYKEEMTMYDENDVEWLAECKRNYDETAGEFLPIVNRIFNTVTPAQFEIVEPDDFNYKIKFQYRGLDVTIQYISGCGDFFVTVVCGSYDEKFINNMPLSNYTEFETICTCLKTMIDMIEY